MRSFRCYPPEGAIGPSAPAAGAVTQGSRGGRSPSHGLPGEVSIPRKFGELEGRSSYGRRTRSCQTCHRCLGHTNI